jgi:hypothetical protein
MIDYNNIQKLFDAYVKKKFSDKAIKHFKFETIKLSVYKENHILYPCFEDIHGSYLLLDNNNNSLILSSLCRLCYKLLSEDDAISQICLFCINRDN